MADDPKDPRYRPFRAAAWGVYLTVAVGFSLLVTVSVFRSVRTMSPGVPSAHGEVLTAAACVSQARTLFDELDAQRQALGRAADPTHVDLRWTKFRLDWLTRARQLQGRCAVDTAGREKLKVMFERLERVLDLYTTATVQFAGGVGPSLEALERSFDEAAK